MLGLSGVPAGPVAGSGGSWSLYAQPGLGLVANTHVLVESRTSSKSQGQLQLLWQLQGFWGQHALLWFRELARDMSITVKTVREDRPVRCRYTVGGSSCKQGQQSRPSRRDRSRVGFISSCGALAISILLHSCHCRVFLRVSS